MQGKFKEVFSEKISQKMGEELKNKKYGIEELLTACSRYYDVTGRRISFEYAVIDGFNDSLETATLLAKKLKGML